MSLEPVNRSNIHPSGANQATHTLPSLHHPLHSYNEFGQLRSVIVGSPVGANHPKIDTSFENFFTPPRDELVRRAAEGPIASWILDEIEEDIAGFIATLQQHGVEVLRPIVFDSTKTIRTPDWETEQLYSLMPRDSLFVFGDVWIEVPSPTRSRLFESLAFRDIAEAYRTQQRATLLSAPKPRLLEHSFDLSAQSFLPETEPMFDGANCVRLGKDIFMDINNSANMAGLNWLQHLFNRMSIDATLHPMHLGEDHADVTLVPLKPGVILVDPKRVNDTNLPKQFKNWTQIRVTDVPNQAYGLSYPLASNGIGRNVFMLNPNTAIVEENQVGLIKELEKAKISTIPLQYRHGRTLGGSFHCITLDTNREGELESYF
jgi:N-dimethylarginine dimethylaminohydrolase